jgi:uncharacterized repeat protein (TIGR03806 family)
MYYYGSLLFLCTSMFVSSLSCIPSVACGDDETEVRPFGIDVRVPWTRSRVVGSPDPPLPYVATQVFTGISWDQPIYAKQEPGTENLVVIQKGGETDAPTRIVRVSDQPEVDEVSLLLAVADRQVYGLTFHPQYTDNGFMYVFSNHAEGESEQANRVTRFTVSRDPAADVACDPETRQVILEWKSMGHDGGDLVFGHDGMLYVTSGDGTSDSDRWLSAQDATNLLGGVLRLDVDHPADGMMYSVPGDNPFVETPGARGELWAIGLRNPWRMSIDDATGQIWVGNNGQDLWETAHLLRRGENYGWSVYEGSHPFYAHREIGPGKLVGPTFEHHHTEARSLTGGVVYYGKQLPDLNGAYVYGDYSTGKIWAGRHDGTQVTFHQEIADTTLQIVGFSNSYRGELLVVDYTGGLYRLEDNPAALRPDENPVFPMKLSDTGIFDSVREHRVATGVVPYDVISSGWNDGAAAERFIALPDDLQIASNGSGGWTFPDRAVLVQTLSKAANINREPTAMRRIETRILVKQQGEWMGYSYEWNEQQDDAMLVPAAGKDIRISGDADSLQEWRIPARAECMSCHARAATYVLGATELQMDRDHHYGAVADNQLRTLEHIGLLSGSPTPADKRQKLANPVDTSASLESRVKSYLQINCACCHVAAGGGNARMKLRYSTPLEDMDMLSKFPQHATFGLAQPRIVAPGDPEQSVMLARLSRRGRGQMPPLVSTRVDTRAVELFREWIASLEPDRKFVRDWSVADLQEQLPKTGAERSLEHGKQLFKTAGCGQCHRIEDEMAGIGPNLTGVATRLKPEEILESIILPSAEIAEKYAATILVTVDGRVVQGRVQSETDEAVIVRGQESFAEPQTILKSDIEERVLSKVSMMPKGNLNHLERDEILDLLSYILSAGH